MQHNPAIGNVHNRLKGKWLNMKRGADMSTSEHNRMREEYWVHRYIEKANWKLIPPLIVFSWISITWVTRYLRFITTHTRWHWWMSLSLGCVHVPWSWCHPIAMLLSDRCCSRCQVCLALVVIIISYAMMIIKGSLRWIVLSPIIGVRIILWHGWQVVIRAKVVCRICAGSRSTSSLGAVELFVIFKVQTR